MEYNRPVRIPSRDGDGSFARRTSRFKVATASLYSYIPDPGSKGLRAAHSEEEGRDGRKEEEEENEEVDGERKEKDGKGSRISGVRDAHAAAWRSANVVSRARLCVRPCKEGVCIGLVPRRSRLKLITSSSDVTGLCPMSANSLAASIARYHFTGFYPELFSIDIETKYRTSRRYTRSLGFELFFNRPFVHRFDRSRENRCFQEESLCGDSRKRG